MKKNYIKRLIGILIMILVVGVFVFVMQDLITNRNDSETVRLKGYYMEDRDSLDVVVMGASEVMSGYSAPEAYRSYGFTSYPYAFTINSVPLWKYELSDIEKTQHPSVLVVETNGALYQSDDYIHSSHCIETLADSMPMSINRIKLAYSLSKHPMERLFPIIKYHYKWKEVFDLRNNDNLLLRRQGYAKLRGVQSRLYKDKYSAEKLYPDDNTAADLNHDAELALRDFLDECKKSHVPHIIFVEFPHVVNDEKHYKRQQRANTAEKIIRKAGFDYISFNDKAAEIGLDYIADFSDTDHMNASGQKKFTEFFCDYLMENYDISPKEQSPENRAKWEESSSLMDSYYKVFNDYTKAHANNPYEKAEYLLTDNCRTINELQQASKK